MRPGSAPAIWLPLEQRIPTIEVLRLYPEFHGQTWCVTQFYRFPRRKSERIVYPIEAQGSANNTGDKLNRAAGRDKAAVDLILRCSVEGKPDRQIEQRRNALIGGGVSPQLGQLDGDPDGAGRRLVVGVPTHRKLNAVSFCQCQFV